MSIKQHGGVFGRNPAFNNVEAEGNVSVQGDLTVDNELGIAVTPEYPLHVSSGNKTVVARFESTDPSAVIEITDSVSTARITNSNSRLQLEADREDESAESEIRFAIDGSLLGRMFDDGTLQLNGGNVKLASGAGIDFSATGDGSGTSTSELFNDYEEGEWTPVVADAASGGNEASVSRAEGFYRKVGSIVTIALDIDNIDKTGLTAGNSVFIRGLPYVPGSVSGVITFTATPFLRAVTLNEEYVVATLSDNTEYIKLEKIVSAANTSDILVSDLSSSSSDIRLSMTYYAF